MTIQQILTFICVALLIGVAAATDAVPAKKTSPPKVPSMTASASTRALFQYHRDDATSDKLTTITLNAVRPQPFPMQKSAGPGDTWQLTLPPHALVVMSFAKK